ncbi:Aminotransferase-like, plant mobile domain [Dillenia turbinata]|uniref:Aminotransferase-like, plant mobile domain n=1 Tax=Dillenia turbinata TaxID=194707 RepID=A0AAN8VZK6_9MAGN
MKRTTRRSSVGVEEVRNSVGNFSTRFSLPSFAKRAEKLNDDQKKAIKKVGFGNLLKIPNQTISKNLLVELMERWSIEKHAFMILSKELKITPMDVALILGLRVTGDPPIVHDDQPFVHLETEYGAATWNRRITVTSLESRLEELGGVADDDFVRTFLLFTFGTFLFPNSNGKVDSRYLALLEDIEEVCHFAWGAAVLEDVFRWLCKRKETNIQYVGGCLIFLQIWSYEHIDIARPSLLDGKMRFPRASRWENSRSQQRQWFATKFKELKENQIILHLSLCSEESETDIVKELVEAQSVEMELSMLNKSLTIPKNDDLSMKIEKLQQGIELSPVPEINIERVSSSAQQDTLKRHQVLDEDKLSPESKEVIKPSPDTELDIAVESSSVRQERLKQVKALEDDNLNLESRRAQQVIELSSEPEMDLPTQSLGAWMDRLKPLNTMQTEPDVQADNKAHATTHHCVLEENELRTRIQFLEGLTSRLEKENGELRRENATLRDKLLSNSMMGEQNVKLKKEVEDLKSENKLLSTSSDGLVSRLERIVLGEDVN